MATDEDILLHWLSIENANDGIYVVDLRGKVLHVNRAFYTMLGYSRGELEHCNVRDWDAKFNPELLHAELSELTDQRKVVHTAYRRKDGSTLHVEVAVAVSYVGGVAVADTIEAMSAHRPYQAGLGIDAALSEIERGIGIQYDPEIAEACL